MPGHGAVREFAEWLLKEQGLFDLALDRHANPAKTNTGQAQ
jgi:3-deoxy-D-manno-octulosonate 8-phosphate phosphatase KdsC-like HAD superfamily phosphatase